MEASCRIRTDDTGRRVMNPSRFSGESLRIAWDATCGRAPTKEMFLLERAPARQMARFSAVLPAGIEPARCGFARRSSIHRATRGWREMGFQRTRLRGATRAGIRNSNLDTRRCLDRSHPSSEYPRIPRPEISDGSDAGESRDIHTFMMSSHSFFGRCSSELDHANGRKCLRAHVARAMLMCIRTRRSPLFV